MTANPDARAELRAALQRTMELLARRFAAQRESGRTAATDPLRGMAIDEEEVEGILRELAVDLARQPVAPPEWTPEIEAIEPDRSRHPTAK